MDGFVIDKTMQLPVCFSLLRNQVEGWLSAQSPRDFPVLLRLFSSDEAVVLHDRSGAWKRRVDIWEPRNALDPWSAFRFRVVETL